MNNHSFNHQFELSEDVKVKEAHFKNGLLNIDLVKESPENIQGEQIPIHSEN